MEKSISVVGLGPGRVEWIASPVLERLEKAHVIIGYHKYLEQIETLFPQIQRESSGMKAEVARVKRAVALAGQGKKVVLVSGGDAGIYGMAGLVYEVLEMDGIADIDVEVLPGISALNAAAALLGAPLMNDFAAISLSDLLTPLEEILQRVSFAAQAGFVLCLYNPCSRQRQLPFQRTCEILNNMLPADTPVGIVRSAYRNEQQVLCLSLKDLSSTAVGMDSLVIIGNPKTKWMQGKMVTQRGYNIIARS